MGSDVPRRAAVALALSLAVLSSPAFAAPTAADRETARSLMDQGRQAQQKGDLKAALQAYKGADAIMHVPTTGIAVAKTQAALGQLVEARDTALAVARLPVEPNEPKVIAEGRKQADDLAAELAPRIPTLTITVKIPAGFTPAVTVDDAAVPYDALVAPRRVNPGHHVVVAKAGNVERRAEVDLAEREAKAVTLEFPAKMAPPPVATGDKDKERPAPAAAPTKTLTSPLVYIGLGLAGAGLATGAVTGLMSMGAVSSAEEQCRDGLCPPSTHGDLDSAQTTATISNIGFIVAGVGAATVVIGLVVGGKRVEVQPAAARARPFVGPGQVGLAGVF